MLKEKAYHANDLEESGDLRISRVKTYKSSEPNIRMDPANILVARLGSRIDGESLNRFFQRLLQSETLPGL